ncbi:MULTISPECIES: acetolactate synthase large subunit [Dyella]|uniref:Acetolactate synthase large subunit n=2 Tax=Dyella TaxID=231454 RepID=A0A4R0YWL7_9GAMM|nr:MULTISPECIES: acetolactate synthase large subunit [Dyella]TBR39081.1 acetolactate synthase large subunit [Dyella terrae]TCI13875.1 acetolactate synthase large subunit [Dyella soli]
MKAAALFVKALEAEGVRRIFGVPGEENLDLVEALRESPIQLIVTRHEQAAGFMAATWGRLTGEAGVALATLGPGATNLVTAAAYAQLGAMPMMMITGQKPIRTHKQGLFQLVDVVDMMQPLTKYTRQLVSAPTIPARVREAFRLAEEERPGAVHLELPEDIARDDVDEVIMLPTEYARRPSPDDAALLQAGEAITSARHPILMIGAAANRQRTAVALRDFIDKLGLPFFTTQMGKGVVDEDHPLWLGNAALSDGDFVHRAIDAADVIINVGHDVVEKPPFFMHKGRRTVIHINFSSAEVDTVYFPQIEVVGDIAHTVERLTDALTPQAHWDFRFFDKVRAAFEQQLIDHSDDPRFPMHPVRVVADTRRYMPDDGVLCLDNGMYKIWYARYYRARQPNTVLLDNALATMGAGLPSAMAAKMVFPDRKVLAICGDGGFMMNAQELETAVRLKQDLVILLLRDDAYGMIRWKQAEMGYPDFGMQFSNPDFVAFAQAHGAQGHRPERAEDFLPTLRKAFDEGGVHLIDLLIDYSDNHRILSEEIRQLSAAIR